MPILMFDATNLSLSANTPQNPVIVFDTIFSSNIAPSNVSPSGKVTNGIKLSTVDDMRHEFSAGRRLCVLTSSEARDGTRQAKRRQIMPPANFG